MKNIVRLTLLYVLFAVLSTTANLGSQALAMALYHGARAVELSILVGTAVGLPLRYLLDKRYIFSFATRDLAHDGRLFLLYACMGVFTTGLFWGIEYGFQRAFGTDAMRYLGGAIGLTLGYFIKYRLDRRFVFVGGAPVAATAAA